MSGRGHGPLRFQADPRSAVVRGDGGPGVRIGRGSGNGRPDPGRRRPGGSRGPAGTRRRGPRAAEEDGRSVSDRLPPRPRHHPGGDRSNRTAPRSSVRRTSSRGPWATSARKQSSMPRSGWKRWHATATSRVRTMRMPTSRRASTASSASSSRSWRNRRRRWPRPHRTAFAAAGPCRLEWLAGGSKSHANDAHATSTTRARPFSSPTMTRARGCFCSITSKRRGSACCRPATAASAVDMLNDSVTVALLDLDMPDPGGIAACATSARLTRTSNPSSSPAAPKSETRWRR